MKEYGVKYPVHFGRLKSYSKRIENRLGIHYYQLFFCSLNFFLSLFYEGDGLRCEGGGVEGVGLWVKVERGREIYWFLIPFPPSDLNPWLDTLLLLKYLITGGVA